MKNCKIYIIKNDLNNKVYIGQTWSSIEKRFAVHCLPSTANHCLKLRRAIDKYGKNNFHIHLLDSCEHQKDADKKEKYFIAFFDSVKNGYNILEGGSKLSRVGTKHSSKTKKKMSNMRKGEKNCNSVLNKKQVKEIRKEFRNFRNVNTGTKYGAITFLSKKYNVAISTIFEIVKNQAWQ